MARQLYVTNISYSVAEEDLLKLFSVAGRVRSVKLLTDAKTGRPKGCGFVEMGSAEEAKEAVLTLDGALLLDRIIKVEEARPFQPRPGSPPVGRKRPGSNQPPGRSRKS